MRSSPEQSIPPSDTGAPGAPGRRLYVLGVDSGGTKSEALLVDASGHVLGQGRCDFRCPQSGRGPGGSGRADSTVLQATQEAMGSLPDHAAAHFVITGCGPLPRGWKPPAPGSSVTFLHVREPDASLALAGASAGVVVLAGTGAFVFARTPDGRELHLDSLGPLLGDAGSAFEIGLRAVRAVARSDWTPRHATSLREPVLQALRSYVGDGRRFHLVDYMLQHRDRSELASLARIVNEHAEAGDAVARGILRDAARSIVETARAVIERLGLETAELPMIAAGSVARCSPIYWRHVCRGVRRFAPGLHPVVPDAREVVGAILAAVPRVQGIKEGFAERLLSETRRTAERS